MTGPPAIHTALKRVYEAAANSIRG